MGGMGFRRLESFNKALLAKQIRRIIFNPESLVARVLKSRYFKHQDVMKANLGSNPSYIWRSLLWSRQLLHKGTWWRIGTGREIETYQDNWILGIRTSLGQVNHEFETVDKLIQGDNWNEAIIENMFQTISLNISLPFLYQQRHNQTQDSGFMIRRENVR